MSTEQTPEPPVNGSRGGGLPRRRTTRLEAAGVGAGVGLALTFPAIGCAVLAAGAGAEIVGRLLFPLVLLLTGGALDAPAFVLAVLQMPVEGALVGAALAAGRPLGALAVLSGHLLAVALCAA